MRSNAKILCLAIALACAGNFVVMHRGGVLEVGATELCQRIFIPLSIVALKFCSSVVSTFTI